MNFQLDQQKIADFVDSEVNALQGLWARVHAQAAELDPEAAAYDNEIRKLNPKHQNGFMAASQKVIWVTSLKNPAKGIRAGRVVNCPPLLAAQLLVGGTHRLATETEIKGWHAEQETRKAEARQAEAIRNPQPPAPVHHIHLSAESLKQAVVGDVAPSASQQGSRENAPAPGQGRGHSGARTPAQATD